MHSRVRVVSSLRVLLGSSFLSVERYHRKLNFQSTSSKLSKANISLVVRVGANDNVKLILVFTFKAASVSSAKFLSLLRTRHTRNSNRIQRSPPILVSSLYFIVIYTMKAQGFKFWGEGSGLVLTIYTKGT